MNIVIVGRGRVGKGLYRWLRDAGEDVALVPGRSSFRAADVHVLAVPDHAIESVATEVAKASSGVILHCAGSLELDAYGSLCGRVGLGCLHPLVSFPPAGFRGSSALEGRSYAFAISGDRRAVRAARRLVHAMNGRVIGAVHGGAYHAAAALVANGAAALADAGIEIFERIGVPAPKARQAVGALLRSVALNVEGAGLPKALTGPIVRGDVEAVQRHRAALRAHERRAYDLSAQLILRTAKRAGLSRSRAKHIAAELDAN